MSFKDIKGHSKQINMLEELIRQKKANGGFLFTGPEGIGKGMVAKILAKAVNCSVGGLDSCDNCPSCLKIDKGNHPDVHIIECENSETIKIEQIRQLQKAIYLMPFEAKTKVFIIDNAHKLTAEAANSLLKILEEPPGNSLIILITSAPGKLFKTILSRCKSLRFAAFDRSALQKILEADYNLRPMDAHFLAYFSEGRIGDSIRLKDTDIIADKQKLIDAFVYSRQFSPEVMDLQKREQVRFALGILSCWFRDIYLIKTGVSYQELINNDRKDDLLKIMNRYTFVDLDEVFQAISDSLLYLEQNVNVKLLVSNLRTVLWKN